MSFDWSNRPAEFSAGVDPEAVFNDPRFAGAVTATLKKMPTLRGVFPFRSIDQRAIDGAGLVTSLPPRPYDGQVVRYLVDASAGWVWTFVYHAGHPGDHKWFYLGGSPASHTVATSETTASTTYTDLATAGPEYTVPLAGVYAVGGGFTGSNDTVDAVCFMSPRVDADTPVDADSVRHASSTAGAAGSPSRSLMAYVTASSPELVVAAQFRVSAGTGTFLNRYLTVTPVRVRAF